MQHVTIGMTLGAALGFAYKVRMHGTRRSTRERPVLKLALASIRACMQTWHWNEKRYIAQYYADLAKKEAKEESARAAAIQAKFKELEEELLSK